MKKYIKPATEEISFVNESALIATSGNSIITLPNGDNVDIDPFWNEEVNDNQL